MRVFVLRGSTVDPLFDVTGVGRRKAIGYLSYRCRRVAPYWTRPVNLDFDQLSDELTARGMEVFPHGSTDGHEAQIAALCQRLPQKLYNRKWVDGFHSLLPLTPEFFAVDPLTMESFLRSNQADLYGYPPTAEAFVDLVRTIWVDHSLPLGRMIKTAFNRGLY